MKFKEFNNWCNARACDGCWGMSEALTCISINEKIHNFPFWKREKIWKEKYEKIILDQIINPTNKLIEKYLGDKNEIIKNS